MAHETPVATGERQTPIEIIQADLREAHDAFYGLFSDPDLEAYCADHDISFDDEETNPEAYWETVADYAFEASDRARESGEPESKIALKELFAATPDFIYQQLALRKHEQTPYLTEEAMEDAADRLGYFNKLVRHVATQYPGIRASTLANSLVNIVNISIQSKSLRRSGDYFINDCIQGAQHERGFGQMAKYARRESREATPDEDMRGADRVFMANNGTDLYVDVKSSLNSVEKTGEFDRPYSRRGHSIVMYSMLTNRDLADRFYIPEELAAERGAVLGDLLDEIDPPNQRAVRHVA